MFCLDFNTGLLYVRLIIKYRFVFGFILAIAKFTEVYIAI
jgi:hypothetical protein